VCRKLSFGLFMPFGGDAVEMVGHRLFCEILDKENKIVISIVLKKRTKKDIPGPRDLSRLEPCCSAALFLPCCCIRGFRSYSTRRWVVGCVEEA
jgi:hypothetical protein